MKHLPEAAAVGAKMETGVAGYSDHKLNFMFQSWVLDMFFDCPPNMGLACPDENSQATVRKAIDAGHITWHAFPHNAQLEVMDPSLIHAGLELTFALDRQFNQSNKTTLSQRDVPGMTRGLIPILRKKGVSAIAIGANDGSTPPSVPPCFKWVDEVSGESLIGLFNWPGYGSLPITHQMTCFAGKHALVYNWNGDNAVWLSHLFIARATPGELRNPHIDFFLQKCRVRLPWKSMRRSGRKSRPRFQMHKL